MRFLALALAAVLLPAVVAVAAAPAARASSPPPGVYEHVSLPPGIDGWSLAAATSGTVVDATGASRGLRVLLAVSPPYSSPVAALGLVDVQRAGLTYSAAPGTEILSWRAERQTEGALVGDWREWVWATGPGDRLVSGFERPAAVGPWRAVALDDLQAERISVGMSRVAAYRRIGAVVAGSPGAASGAGGGAEAASVELGVRNAVAVLRDVSPPTAAPAVGPLADAQRLRGVVRLAAAATDRGAGLRRTVVLVDGAYRTGTQVDGGAACRDLASGTTRRYAARVPCPLAATVESRLDTTGLADGPHAIEVLVEDAAGNRTTLVGPAVREVDNRPLPPAPTPTPTATPAPPVPSPPLAVAHVHASLSAARPVAFGSSVSVRGRVTDAADRAIARRRLTLLAGVAGGPWRRAGLAISGRDGGFTVRSRATSSRRLVVVMGDVRSAELTLDVRAAVQLTTARHGRWTAVAGGLRGGYVPRGGVLVTVQRHAGDGWRDVTVLRTTASGRFRGRVAVPPRARLRVAVPAQRGYPFAAGASPSRPAAPR